MGGEEISKKMRCTPFTTKKSRRVEVQAGARGQCREFDAHTLPSKKAVGSWTGLVMRITHRRRKQ